MFLLHGRGVSAILHVDRYALVEDARARRATSGGRKFFLLRVRDAVHCMVRGWVPSCNVDRHALVEDARARRATSDGGVVGTPLPP